MTLYYSLFMNPRPPDDYQLKLDEQVNHFYTLKHNLTFFIITAAVGTLGFSINFLITNKLITSTNIFNLTLIILASLAALLCSGLSVLALNKDIKSFQLHLKYRHKRLTYEQLNSVQQEEWDESNKIASRARKYSLGLLVFTVTLLLFTIIILFIQKGEKEMGHHYGEDSTEVVESNFDFHVIFRNKVSNQNITMNIPKDGVKENSTEPATKEEVENLSREIAHLLRKKFK